MRSEGAVKSAGHQGRKKGSKRGIEKLRTLVSV